MLNEKYELIDRFSSYVAPQFGHINSFIEGMTRITPKDVANAPTAAKALQKFVAWLPKNTKFVAWSDSDRLQISKEIMSKQIKLTVDLSDNNLWIDCQQLFGDRIASSHPYNLTQALNISGIDYLDGAHDGCVDAYNTALLFRKLQTETNFKLSDYYNIDSEQRESESLGFSLGTLLNGLNLQQMLG